ncbi:MAG: hypothetical protein AB1763_02515 [Campylobacterota bacterium]
MTEKELVEMMYGKHKKWLLNANEAAAEWGSSYSALSKLFGGSDALPEKMLLQKQIIPPWTMFGQKRMWKITDIAAWLVNTENTEVKK